MSNEEVTGTLCTEGLCAIPPACSASGLSMQFRQAEVVFGLLVSLELFTAKNQLSSCFAETQFVSHWSKGGHRNSVRQA